MFERIADGDRLSTLRTRDGDGDRTAGVDTDRDGDPGDDGESRSFVDRGRSLYDWYGRHDRLYGLVTALSRPIRREAVEALDPSPGDAVVDVGCGPGSNLAMLRERVGPDGLVVGVDLSPEMVRAACRRVRDRGCENVAVVRGDATDLPLEPGSVDGALATLALTATPDGAAVARSVADALVPGGAFVVVDGRLSAETIGPAARLFVPVARRVANYNPDVDPVAAVEAAFPTTEVVATHDGGATVVVRGRRD